jgi:hypothetical protein
MPLYDADNRLADDQCAILTRLRDNESILAYSLYDKYGMCGKQCKDRKEKIREFSTQHPNLRYWDGYGMAPCDVDGDSQLKHEAKWTNPRSRQQLSTRVFGAAPDLSRGEVMPNIESTLIAGGDTSYQRQCGRLAEQDWDRFAPNVDVQCVEHIVPQWTWGGDSSRDIARSKDFLETIGYRLEDGGFTCYASQS